MKSGDLYNLFRNTYIFLINICDLTLKRKFIIEKIINYSLLFTKNIYSITIFLGFMRRGISGGSI